MSRSSNTNWLLLAAAFAPVAGCLVVTPLDDLPSKTQSSTTGGSSHGGKGGSSNGGTGGTDTSSGGSGATGATAGKPPVDDGPCKTNVECMDRNFDEPQRCRPSDNKCIPLATPDCPVVYGNAASPNAVYFGAFATLDPAAPGDNSIAWSHELAIDELSGDLLGGLPGPNKTRRPLVMVLCNNATNVNLGLEHLIHEVEVPAMVATLQPGDLRRAYEDYGDRDVLYFSPVTISDALSQEDDSDHIWGLLGEPKDFAPSYAALLTLSEAYVRSGQTDEQKKQPLRVALVTTNDAFDQELTQAVTDVLTFNGKSLAANGGDFIPLTIGAKPDFVQLADNLAAEKPDIIISTAGDAFVMTNGLEQRLEEEWEVVAIGKPRPFYILSPYNAGNLQPLLKRLSGRLMRDGNTDVQERYVGVSIASAADNTLQNAYAISLGGKHHGALTDTANYYDATYFLAYAMLGANQPDGLTGTGIAQGLHRLLSGDPLNVGPKGINTAYSALSDDSSTIKLQSTLGPPDFDRKTGVRPVDGSVFCIDREATTVTVKVKNDVLRYDNQAGKFKGDLPCISGFFQP